MATPQSCYLVSSSSKSLLLERLVTARQATHLTRSIPSKASDSEAGSLVTTASLATQTPCSLAPISAPQSQDGLLSTTAWVFGTCSISIYVHCRESRKRKNKIIAVLLSNPLTEVTRLQCTDGTHVIFKKSMSCVWVGNFFKQQLTVMFEPLHPYIAKVWQNKSLLIVADFKESSRSARSSRKPQ